MKKAILVLAAVSSLFLTSAQSLNENGLYVDNEGALFSGVVSQHQEGIRSELQVKDGQIDGAAKYFYASGKLMETGSFVNGKKDQKWERYSENGTVTAIAFYHLGKKAGTWMVYDETGKKRFEMTYQDGQKAGIWTSWDEQGNVLQQKDYASVN